MERPSGFQTAFRGFGQKENWGRKLSSESFLPQTPSFKDFRRYRIPLHSFSYFDSIRLSAGFFCGQKNADSILPFLRIGTFPPFQSQTKRQDPSFSSGCHFRKTVNRDSIRGKVLEGREEGMWGRREGNFLQKVSLSPP
ncbi:hypothetical protein, partial [Bilophila wadsworthia]|uniref:hypothetical protein n=1 Tax=Bilophila wadsworthia TaxID=35833 RepID=UPI002671903F